MKQPAHPYTELDIAEYVLGVSTPDDSAAIQGWLARDDAAAACALKWEAYLLDIAGTLPDEAPSPLLHARIQGTLGFAGVPNVETIFHEGREAHHERPQPATARRRRRAAPRLRRGRVAAAAAVLAAVILSVVLGVAAWRPTGQQTTEQSVHLTPVNPALPASTRSDATGRRG